MTEPLGEKSAARRLVFALKAHHEALPPAVRAELQALEKELGAYVAPLGDDMRRGFEVSESWVEGAIARAQESAVPELVKAARRAIRDAVRKETESLQKHVDALEALIVDLAEEKQHLTGVRDHVRALEEMLGEARRAKNDAYSQRNKLVAAFARMALKLGWKAGVGQHQDEANKEWEDDWRTIVFVDTPAGQVSWHFHDSETWMLEDLPKYRGKWDGHTDEEKWERLATSTRA